MNRPVVAPPGPWSFPLPETSHLDNGLRVHAYDLPGQYVVSARLVVPFGLNSEPEGQDGVAAMTARLLDEGTSRHTGEEFAALLERHGIAFGAGVNDGGLMVDLDVPRRHLGVALHLLTEAVADPVFPEAQVRRILRSRLAEIEQERASSPHRAARELIATMYAGGSRAALPTAGRAESIQALTRSKIAAFHARTLAPDQATLVLAGDLGGLELDGLVTASLGQWRSGPTQIQPSAAPIPAPDAARLVIVDRPDSVQTEISIGCPGPDRSSPAWPAYPVIGFILGGSPNARIDAVLREEKGYTYGIRSSFRPRAVGGSFVTSGSVRGEVAGESVEILLGLLAKARDGFTAEEVRMGSDYVSGTAPARYATADAVADEAAALALESLPLDFPTTTLAQVRALTDEDLGEAYRAVVGQDLTVILVGDAAQIEPAVRGRTPFDVSVVTN